MPLNGIAPKGHRCNNSLVLLENGNGGIDMEMRRTGFGLASADLVVVVFWSAVVRKERQVAGASFASFAETVRNLIIQQIIHPVLGLLNVGSSQQSAVELISDSFASRNVVQLLASGVNGLGVDGTHANNVPNNIRRAFGSAGCKIKLIFHQGNVLVPDLLIVQFSDIWFVVYRLLVAASYFHIKILTCYGHFLKY